MDSGTVAIALPADTALAQAALTHGRRLARDLGLSWFALFVEQRDRRSRHRLQALDALVVLARRKPSAHRGR